MNSNLNLLPDEIIPTEINNNTFKLTNIKNKYALLKIKVNTVSWFPCDHYITIVSDIGLRTQYLPINHNGIIYIDLSWIEEDSTIKLQPHHVDLAKDAEILFFNKNDDLSGTTLIIAPHPDDSELCCTSFYNENTFILTITAGEKITDLKKQYFSEMDNDLKSAAKRKGALRVYNSLSTPILGGVKSTSLLNLGYSDSTIKSMYENPKDEIKSPYGFSPNDFRNMNQVNKQIKLIENPLNQLKDLKKELQIIIEELKPKRIVVTNPFTDSHNDHRYIGKIALDCLYDISYPKPYVYLYTVHIEREKEFHYGPALSHISVPNFKEFFSYTDLSKINFSYASFELNQEQQKMKTIMLGTMYDIYSCKDHRYISSPFANYFGCPRLGKSYYYQRFVKSNETFLLIKQ